MPEIASPNSNTTRDGTKTDLGNMGWQSDLASSYNLVGDVLRAQGKLAEALKAYRDSVAINERLAAADPSNAGWQRNLSVSYNQVVRYGNVGSVLQAQGNLPDALNAYRDALTIRERLAKTDPGNTGWQSDLASSYNLVGSVLQAQ